MRKMLHQLAVCALALGLRAIWGRKSVYPDVGLFYSIPVFILIVFYIFDLSLDNLGKSKVKRYKCIKDQ